MDLLSFWGVLFVALFSCMQSVCFFAVMGGGCLLSSQFQVCVSLSVFFNEAYNSPTIY
jgi:hypothetical protein